MPILERGSRKGHDISLYVPGLSLTLGPQGWLLNFRPSSAKFYVGHTHAYM